MRVKILKTIDENLLDKAIDKYEYGELMPDTYLIMSSETAKELAVNAGMKYTTNVSHGGIYKGNKIAINESIPFGEVEIR